MNIRFKLVLSSVPWCVDATSAGGCPFCYISTIVDLFGNLMYLLLPYVQRAKLLDLVNCSLLDSSSTCVVKQDKINGTFTLSEQCGSQDLYHGIQGGVLGEQVLLQKFKRPSLDVASQ